jgi:hypothetical protein
MSLQKYWLLGGLYPRGLMVHQQKLWPSDSNTNVDKVRIKKIKASAYTFYVLFVIIYFIFIFAKSSWKHIWIGKWASQSNIKKNYHAYWNAPSTFKSIFVAIHSKSLFDANLIVLLWSLNFFIIRLKKVSNRKQFSSSSKKSKCQIKYILFYR